MTAVQLDVAHRAGSIVADDFEVGYVTEEGIEHRVPLADVWSSSFEDGMPVRRFTRGRARSMPDDIVDTAKRWERHIVAVTTGLPPGCPRHPQGPIRRRRKGTACPYTAIESHLLISGRVVAGREQGDRRRHVVEGAGTVVVENARRNLKTSTATTMT